jgi:CheY-like chemotaxis protein
VSIHGTLRRAHRAYSINIRLLGSVDRIRFTPCLAWGAAVLRDVGRVGRGAFDGLFYARWRSPVREKRRLGSAPGYHWVDAGFALRATALAKGTKGRHVILVVDDDEATRSLIEQRLRHQGFPTASANGSRAALTMLHEGAKPCLILLDVMMPGEPGWDYVERLLKNPALNDVPVELMSANPTAMTAYQRVRGAERSSHLPKPLDVKKLVSLAASHCRCRLPQAESR